MRGQTQIAVRRTVGPPRRPRPSPLVRALAALALTPALVAPLGGCGRSRQSDDAIEVVVKNERATLDPRFSTHALDIRITRLVHAGLVGLHPDSLAPVPLVAASWERRGPRRLTVTLKPGVRFHSGRPLVARDVCATLMALRDPDLGSPHRAVVDAIGTCTAPTPLTVELTLRKPRATLLTDLEVPILRADQARLPPDPDGHLDGLGPFTLAGLDRGEVRLAPARTGVLPPPRHPVVIRTVRDENARALRLFAGRADVAPNAISPSLLPAFDGRRDLSVQARPGANVAYLLMQNDRAPFAERRVRKAIGQAIDRERLVATLLAGRARVATGLLPPGHWAAPPGRQALPFDGAAAQPVLRAVRPMTLLTSTDRSRLTIARVVAQMLGDAGLQVRVVALDLGVMLERLDHGDFDLAILQIPELTEPHVLSWFFHPDGVPGEGGQGRNRIRYRNPAAAALFDAGGATTDRDARRRAYAALEALIRADLPLIPLWHEDQVAVVSSRAATFRPDAAGRWLDLARLP